MRIARWLAVPLVVVACQSHGAGDLDRFAEITAKGSSPDQRSGPAVSGAGAPASRKVIRDLDVSMRVKDADSFLRQLDENVSSAGGYVANRELTRGTEGVGWGSVTVRVPSAKVSA